MLYETSLGKIKKSDDLLLVLLISGLGLQDVATLTGGVGLVLQSKLGEVADDVLHLGVVVGTALATDVGKGGDGVEEVVDDGDDDGNTDGVAPDDNNGDDVGVAVEGLDELRHGVVEGNLVRVAGEPTEDTEEGSEGIDGTDGDDELPRGEGLTATGDEDEPVLSEGDLKEENLLNVTPVLHDTTVGNVHGSTDDPGGEGKKHTENSGDDPDLGKLPLDGTLLGVSVVVGNSNGGQIGEEGDEDDELRADGLVDDDHGGDKVDLQVQAEGDTVLDVGLHALENLTSLLDGKDDGGKTRSKEDNIGGGLGSLGGTLDGNTTVRLLERGSIVDTVTSHGSQVTTLLEHLDDLVLVLGEDLSETVSTLDEIVLSGTGKTTVDKLVRVVNLGTESKHLASLLSDSDGVTSKHLDGDTKLLGLDDGLGSVLTGRVEHRKHTEEDPGVVVLLVSDTEGTETTTSELGSLVTEEVGSLLGAAGKVEDGLGGTLGASETVAAESADSGDTLGDGVEGSELLGLPVILEDVTGLGVTLEGQDGNLVNGVEVLDVVGRSEGGASHHPVDILTLSDVGLTDRELVGSESTGLVRAENVDTSEGLNGSELLNNSLLLGEVGGADSEGGGGNDGKTDGDTDDEQNKSVVQERVGGCLRSGDLQVTEEATDPGEENPEHDEDEESGTDVVHDSLEVTLVLSTLDKSGSATDERVLGRGLADSVGLAALATGGVVDDVTHELVDSEGLASDGRLVGGDDGVTLVGNTLTLVLVVLRAGRVLLGVEGVLLAELLVLGEVLRGVVVADKTGISGDGLALLDDDNVTGDELAGLDVRFLTITDDSCLHGNVTLERSDDIGGLLFLVPTDDSVEKKNTDNHTEINPATKTGSEEDSEFHNCASLAPCSWRLQQCLGKRGGVHMLVIAPRRDQSLQKQNKRRHGAIGGQHRHARCCNASDSGDETYHRGRDQ